MNKDEYTNALFESQFPPFDQRNTEFQQIWREPFIIAHLEAINSVVLYELEGLISSSRSIVNTFNEFQQSDEEQMHYFEQNLNRIDLILNRYKEVKYK